MKKRGVMLEAASLQGRLGRWWRRWAEGGGSELACGKASDLCRRQLHCD